MSVDKAQAQPTPINTEKYSHTDPNISGFDLVFLVMVLLYKASEQTLRSRVDKLRGQIEEVERYNNLKVALKNSEIGTSPKTIETLLGNGTDFEGFEVEDIKGVDNKDVSIGKKIVLSEGSELHIYYADDPSTKEFNEQTGSRVLLGPDGKVVDLPGVAETFEDVTFRAVLVENGKPSKEFISFKSDDGTQTLRQYSLEEWNTTTTGVEAGEFYSVFIHHGGGHPLDWEVGKPITNGDGSYVTLANNELSKNVDAPGSNIVVRNADNGTFEVHPGPEYNAPINGFVVGNAGYVRKDSSDLNSDFSIGVGDATIEIGVTENGFTGFGIYKAGEPLGLEFSKSYSGPVTQSSLNIKTVESGEIDKNFGEDSSDDQYASYEGLRAGHQEKLKELGFVDGKDSDDNLTQEFIEQLEDLGLEIDENTVFDSAFVTRAETQIDSKIDSITSLNAIDQLYMEKAFNNLNTIVTSLTNMLASENRAKLAVANNL